jgi:hypothetical protein
VSERLETGGYTRGYTHRAPCYSSFRSRRNALETEESDEGVGINCCFHAEGSQELKDWIARQTKKLRNGVAGAIITGLREELAKVPKTGPGNKGKRERLAEIIEHLVKNQQRLRYKEMRNRDLDIGSGAVEGAVRNLIRMRFDGPGMRWSRGRSERRPHLRCILLNSQWTDFASHLARRHIQLAAQPIPTQTHDAKAAA